MTTPASTASAITEAATSLINQIDYLVGFSRAPMWDDLKARCATLSAALNAAPTTQPAPAAPSSDALDACRALVAYDESDDSDAFVFMQRYADAVYKARAAIAASTKGATS